MSAVWYGLNVHLILTLHDDYTTESDMSPCVERTAWKSKGLSAGPKVMVLYKYRSKSYCMYLPPLRSKVG